jgi:hypothetical protein
LLSYGHRLESFEVPLPFRQESRIDSSIILHGENVAIVGENISFLLPGIDYYQMQYIHNERPISYLDQSIMFLKAVCSLYNSTTTTISPNFQVFFRASMHFLLAGKGHSSALNLEQGELLPDQEIQEIFPVKADDSVLLMTTTGNFVVAREGIKSGDAVALFSGFDKPFVVKPTGMSYFMPSLGFGYDGRRAVAIRR